MKDYTNLIHPLTSLTTCSQSSLEVEAASDESDMVNCTLVHLDKLNEALATSSTTDLIWSQ